MLRCFVTCLVLSCSITLSAQTANWYFGKNAGIKFENGEVVATTNGALVSFEGTATISDKEGKLLLYTNGEKIWNKDHQVITDGLKGNNSSTQSSVIVSHPDTPDLYYVFAIDALDNDLKNGLTYSIVDIRTQKVTSKNVTLIAPVAEKITVTQHVNEKDLWIVVHEWMNNRFHSFLLQKEGVVTESIQSDVGSIHTSPTSNSQGAMKVSPSGNKIAVAKTGSNTVEIFDFDNSTGSISNPSQKNITAAYGVEFSADDSKLYVSSLLSTIYEFNMNADDHGIVIGSTDDIFLGSLQLGLDEKIYVARYQSGYLGVIEDSKFKANGIFLAGRECSFGLPNFNTSFFKPKPVPPPPPPVDIKIPDVITPNDDGINDTFEIQGLDIEQWSINIYNRWGNRIYRSESYSNDWSAEHCTDGIYYFILSKPGKDNIRGWINVLK